MKKNALRKDTFREIRHSIGRFLSILLIIACGVGVFTGIKATAPSMYETAEEYFTAQSLYDIELLSTIGFSDEDITKVKEIKEVDKVMPAYSVDVLSKKDNKESVVKVMSLPGEKDDEVNVPTIVEGRLPEKENECVSCKGGLIGKSFEIGDTVKIEPQVGDTVVNTVLKQSEYKVVGIVEMPQFISYTYGTSSVGDGYVSAVILVQKSLFSYPRYTEAYLTFKCHAEGVSAFDEEYENIFKSVSTQLDEIGLKQYQAFIKMNEDQIAAAEAEIAKGRAELEAAAKQISDAEEQIRQGQIDLENGEDAYAAASASTRQRLADARTQLDAGWTQYNASQAEYAEAKQLVDQAQEIYYMAVTAVGEIQIQYDAEVLPYQLSDSTWAWIQETLGYSDEKIAELKSGLSETTREEMGTLLTDATTRLKEAGDQLADAQQQLADAEVQLNAAQNQLNAAEIEYAAAKAQADAELAAAREELDNGALELAEAREEYYYGLAKYNSEVGAAEAELTNGQNRIQNAKLQLGKYMSGKWYALGRSEVMTNYSGYKEDADRLDAIGNVFPVFFLLVAALVCMTTMTRMIDEQRLQIGTYKALGYKKGEIVSKYLIYAALAGILGCIIGPIIFIEILPRVIFAAYGTLYSLPYFHIQVPWLMVGVSVVVALLCTVLVAYITCAKEMRSQAATLMRPKAPKAGKQILLEKMTFLWNRFNFFQKLTARNLFRYKRRLLMTVIGITGCMALIVAGFGLDDAISPIGELQFGEITLFDVSGYLNDSISSADFSATMTALRADKRVDSACMFNQTDVKAIDEEATTVLGDTYLCVPESPNTVLDYIAIRDPKTKEPLTLRDDGAIVTQKMADKLNLKIGDHFIMKIGEKKYVVNVTDIAENYLYNYIYMTPNYYLKLTNTTCTYNMVYINASDQLTDNVKFVQDWLKQSDKFVTMYFTSDLSGVMEDTISSLRLVVVVMIVCAGLLAFIVLYNLTNINISERIREIATVKVLGFNDKEVNSYVFRENIVMCILGILTGCVGGYFLAQFIIKSVEVSMCTFCKEIHFTSYLFAAGLTLLFTVLVNLFMSKIIKKISMVESLKAIE